MSGKEVAMTVLTVEGFLFFTDGRDPDERVTS